MGYGKELYGFQTPLTHTSKPFCLAVYAIKNLIDELAIQNSQMNMDPPFEKVCTLIIFTCFYFMFYYFRNMICCRNCSISTSRLRKGYQTKW